MDYFASSLSKRGKCQDSSTSRLLSSKAEHTNQQMVVPNARPYGRAPGILCLLACGLYHIINRRAGTNLRLCRFLLFHQSFYCLESAVCFKAWMLTMAETSRCLSMRRGSTPYPFSLPLGLYSCGDMCHE